MTQQPVLYTPAEVAGMVRKSTETVRRWAREGRIEAIVLPGGSFRFTAKAVARLTTSAPRQRQAA